MPARFLARLHHRPGTARIDIRAVIIGQRAKGVSKDSALHHVFGYSGMNDISARDNRRAGQWIY
jgi:2-keto-4-pentenoate hydratase/2-oxohepta-3-ene-1,7-dioic acid hydratase in catechol pathway